MDNRIRVAAIIVASLGVIITSVMLFRTYSEYRKGEEEYAALESYVGADTQKTDEQPHEEEITGKSRKKRTKQGYLNEITAAVISRIWR